MIPILMIAGIVLMVLCPNIERTSKGKLLLFYYWKGTRQHITLW